MSLCGVGGRVVRGCGCVMWMEWYINVSLCGVAGLWMWVARLSVECGCVMWNEMRHECEFVWGSWFVGGCGWPVC